MLCIFEKKGPNCTSMNISWSGGRVPPCCQHLLLPWMACWWNTNLHPVAPPHSSLSTGFHLVPLLHQCVEPHLTHCFHKCQSEVRVNFSAASFQSPLWTRFIIVPSRSAALFISSILPGPGFSSHPAFILASFLNSPLIVLKWPSCPGLLRASPTAKTTMHLEYLSPPPQPPPLSLHIAQAFLSSNWFKVRGEIVNCWQVKWQVLLREVRVCARSFSLLHVPKMCSLLKKPFPGSNCPLIAGSSSSSFPLPSFSPYLSFLESRPLRFIPLPPSVPPPNHTVL